MKKLSIIVSLLGILALSIFLFGFISDNIPEQKLEAIKQDIPDVMTPISQALFKLVIGSLLVLVQDA